MPVEGPSSTSAFNQLPSLFRSHDHFTAHDGLAVVDKLGSLFADYKLADRFGVTLLHRHFSLKPNQRLVDVNGTSTPWDISPVDGNDESTSIEKHGGIVRPHWWMLSKPTAEGEPYKLFAAVLAAHDLIGTLGLCLLRDDLDEQQQLFEVTEGRANITFVRHQSETVLEGAQLLEAQWPYSDGKGGGVVCPRKCKRVRVENTFFSSGTL
ncbi:hypothetical protein VTO42DRAFT_2883 [Malbranchea cinnamomea]